MNKKFLGLISILYSFLFVYLIITNNISNYLAPQMHIYIKISIIPLFIIGILLLFVKSNDKFKISNICLLLPIIFIFFSGDGLLTIKFALNRSTNFKVEKRVKQEETTTIPVKAKEEKKDIYDFNNPYFDIIDENYNDLSGYLTFSEKANKYVGKTIKVKGFVLKSAEFLTSEYFALGKYAITCCAADAEFTGFVVKYGDFDIQDGSWYEIEGILRSGIDSDGYNMNYIEVININEIDKNEENQYVYQCFYYDNGSCEAVNKYNLEY